MNTIQNSQTQKQIESFLSDYLDGLIKGENRKQKGNIECGIDEEQEEIYCAALTERKEDDPKLLQNGGYHDWKSDEDYSDFGTIVIMYVADWEGTLVSAAIPLSKGEWKMATETLSIFKKELETIANVGYKYLIIFSEDYQTIRSYIFSNYKIRRVKKGRGFIIYSFEYNQKKVFIIEQVDKDTPVDAILTANDYIIPTIKNFKSFDGIRDFMYLNFKGHGFCPLI